jgi:hypothetical protein
MRLFVLRMRNGNCVVAAAENEAAARERAKDIGQDIEIASVRELSSFVAQFTLTDEGASCSTGRLFLTCTVMNIPCCMPRFPIHTTILGHPRLMLPRSHCCTTRTRGQAGASGMYATRA